MVEVVFCLEKEAGEALMKPRCWQGVGLCIRRISRPTTICLRKLALRVDVQVLVSDDVPYGAVSSPRYLG